MYALDLPGFGLSPLGGRRSSLPANVALICRVLRRLDAEPVLLVGSSMGGLLSLGGAAYLPERVRGLVLVGAALPRPRGHRRGPGSLARDLALVNLSRLATWEVQRLARRGGAELLVRRVLADCAVDVRRLDPDVVTAHIELERRRIEEDVWREPLRVATRSLLRALAERSRVERWIRSVTVPTLVIHGRADRIVSFAGAAGAVDLRPDWELHVLDDTGHLPMLEAPDLFVRITRRWMQRQPWYGASSGPRVPALAG